MASTPAGGASRKRKADSSPEPPAVAGKRPKTSRLTAEMEEEIRCPLCHFLPLGEILQCGEGHTVCKSCQEASGKDTCSVCEGPMKTSAGLWMRSGLEKMLDRMSIPCRFQDQGCEKVLPRGELRQHLEECDKSGDVIRICHHLPGGENCDFRINRRRPQEAFQHLKECHDGWQYNDQEFKMKLREMDSKVQLPVLLTNEEEAQRYSYLLLITVDPRDDAVSLLALSLKDPAADHWGYKKTSVRTVIYGHTADWGDMEVKMRVVPFVEVPGALEKPPPVRLSRTYLMDMYENEEQCVTMDFIVDD